jgi:hypothetical protein
MPPATRRHVRCADSLAPVFPLYELAEQNRSRAHAIMSARIFFGRVALRRLAFVRGSFRAPRFRHLNDRL